MRLIQQAFTAFPGVWTENQYRKLHPNAQKRADPKDFEAWYPNIDASISFYIRPSKGDPNRWVKITWESTKPTLTCRGIVKKRKVHKYVMCVDPKSEHAGNIYSDDPKWLIYSKFFACVVGRPIHLVFKTAYHVSMLGVAKAIFDGIRKDSSKKEFSARIIRSLADCVRTPIYELALTLTALGALVSAPFKPSLVYDFRAMTGQLACELNWGKKHLPPADLTPCMYAIGNIMNFEKDDRYHSLFHEKQYKDKNQPILVAFDNRL